MRTWRKIALGALAAVVALPAFADRGHGYRFGPHRHGSHGHARWHGAHGPFVHHPGAVHGYYVRRHWRHRPYSYASISLGYPVYPSVYPYSRYGYDYPAGTTRASYAMNGLVLGALAGAVIGNNSGDLGNSAWRGAALGGVAGLAAGAIAENRMREPEQRPAVTVDGEAATDTAASGEMQAAATGEASRPTVREKPSRMADANRLFGR